MSAALPRLTLVVDYHEIETFGDKFVLAATRWEAIATSFSSQLPDQGFCDSVTKEQGQVGKLPLQLGAAQPAGIGRCRRDVPELERSRKQFFHPPENYDHVRDRIGAYAGCRR